MKITDRIKGVFEVFFGSFFLSPIFLGIRLPVPVIFKNSILIPNFIFISFNYFLVGEERGKR